MIAYLNGEFLPLVDAKLPVWDFGFTMGISLTERLRTYSGQLPLLDLHLERMFAGAEVIGMGGTIDRVELARAIEEVVQQNLPLVQAGVELSIGVCITPGSMGAMSPEGQQSDSPTVLVTATQLQAWMWQDAYRDGVRLMTVDVQEIPGECIPRTLKHRNRLHYYLAEQQATARSPGSRALLLDADGFITEGTTASIVAVKDGKLIRPSVTKVLPSVSLSYALPMLIGMGLEVVEKDSTVAEFQAADEVLWFSSPMAVLPVSAINGVTIGSYEGQNADPNNAMHRPVLNSVLSIWSERTGTELVYRKKRKKKKR